MYTFALKNFSANETINYHKDHNIILYWFIFIIKNIKTLK